jgi:hypothetical protein
MNQYQMNGLEYMIRMYKQNLSMILLAETENDVNESKGGGGLVSFFKFIHNKTKTKKKTNTI